MPEQRDKGTANVRPNIHKQTAPPRVHPRYDRGNIGIFADHVEADSVADR
jgi:hypothetical protein